MLTNAFYRSLAEMLAGEPSLPGELFIAVGTLPDDRPEPDRDSDRLTQEVARRSVEATVYLDDDGSESERPTTRVRFTTRFRRGEVLGELHECGLFGGNARDQPDSGTLFSCFRHDPIAVTEGTTLDRAIEVDLTPRSLAPGMVPTRWLGNVTSREVHDMEHLTGACQESEIRIDNRFYFAGVDEAADMGYDRCAFCFGRERSQR